MSASLHPNLRPAAVGHINSVFKCRFHAARQEVCYTTSHSARRTILDRLFAQRCGVPVDATGEIHSLLCFGASTGPKNEKEELAWPSGRRQARSVWPSRMPGQMLVGSWIQITRFRSKGNVKAIADRAEWHAKQRRWLREGKRPRPG